MPAMDDVYDDTATAPACALLAKELGQRICRCSPPFLPFEEGPDQVYVPTEDRSFRPEVE